MRLNVDMAGDLRNTFILGLSFLALFGIAELLYHKLHVKAENSRKFVHAVTGVLTLLFPVMINNLWLVLLLCLGFLIVLIASLRFNLIKSINAIDRRSYGTLTYPIAIFGCYLAYEYTGNNFTYYYLPILTLAFCDPLAAIFGRRWPYGKIKNKTIVGSSAFFVSAFILAFLMHRSVVNALLIALFSTIAEAVTPHGLDNLTIPGSVLLVLFIS
jgi:phytol kinase